MLNDDRYFKKVMTNLQFTLWEVNNLTHSLHYVLLLYSRLHHCGYCCGLSSRNIKEIRVIKFIINYQTDFMT